MTDLFSGLFNVFHQVANAVTTTNYTTKTPTVFAAQNYDAFNGNPGLVNKPGVGIATRWPIPPENIETVLPAGRRLLLNPMYQAAWTQRKLESRQQSNYLLDSTYQYHVFQEVRGRTLNGEVLSSRDPH